MKHFILDFDHTLYDTTAFVEDARRKNLMEELVTPRIWNYLDADSYYYSDTLAFLSDLRDAKVTILTACSPDLGPEASDMQREKLKQSGVSNYVHDIVIMTGDKAPYVQDLYTGEDTYFVDDSRTHVESVKDACPTVHCVQILRDGFFERDSYVDVSGESPRSDIGKITNMEDLQKLSFSSNN